MKPLFQKISSLFNCPPPGSDQDVEALPDTAQVFSIRPKCVKMKPLFQKIIRCLFNGPPPGDQDTEAQPDTADAPRYRNLDWAKIFVVFCLASAIAIALLSAQVYSQLPLTFYFLSFTLIFSFTCFFIAKFIHLTRPQPAQVLDRFGIFFRVTAFFISITIPFPMWFKCTTGLIYLLSWLAILVCK